MDTRPKTGREFKVFIQKDRPNEFYAASRKGYGDQRADPAGEART